MAPKTANKSQKLQNKEKEATPLRNSWPNLPQQLLGLIARNPSLMQNITSFGCVIKSWRSPSKHCSPNGKNQWSQLIEIQEKPRGDHYKKNERSHVIEIPFHEVYFYPYYKRRSYNDWYPGIYFKGHSHGQIVVLGSNFSEAYLWEPARRTTRFLLHWDTNLPFKLATLSSKPDEHVFSSRPARNSPKPEDRFPCSVMVITGISHPAFAFFRRESRERAWILENCDVKDPFTPNQNMQFSNVIGFRGKFYALSLQGSLVVIEDVDSRFRITGVGGNRAVPSRTSRQFRECLVESDGEILLVFLISRKRLDLVDDVEVFRLDLNEYLWMKVENLGGRTLFLEDECCMWVNGSKVGCTSNCIYFTHHRADDQRFVYEIRTGHIFPISGDFMRWDEPVREDYSPVK